MAHKIADLPLELQDMILEACNGRTLAVLCRCSKAFNAKCTPLLWRCIDFVDSPDWMGLDDIAWDQMAFFAACDTLMQERPGRWLVLSSHVQVLKLLKVPGLGIGHNCESLDDALIRMGGGDGPQEIVNRIYDIICYFTNLEVLSLFVKESYLYLGPEASDCEFTEDLTKLKSLKIGGEVSAKSLLSLLSAPEDIEELALIKLVQQAHQGERPLPVLFLSPIQHRLTQLKILHLCKLARVQEGLEDELMMNWQCEAESEQAVISEWFGLLETVSSTSQKLTLENSFHSFEPHVWSDMSESEDDYTSIDIRSTYRDLFIPFIVGNEWPKLEKLTFVGIDMLGATQSRPESFDYLDDRGVLVTHRGISLVHHYYEVTPMATSPPDTLFLEDGERHPD